MKELRIIKQNNYYILQELIKSKFLWWEKEYWNDVELPVISSSNHSRYYDIEPKISICSQHEDNVKNISEIYSQYKNGLEYKGYNIKLGIVHPSGLPMHTVFYVPKDGKAYSNNIDTIKSCIDSWTKNKF